MQSPVLVMPLLDLESLRCAVQDEYTLVALEPERGFHFHTGRPLARLLGYQDEWLRGIPETSIESFAGTGTPSAWGGWALASEYSTWAVAQAWTA